MQVWHPETVRASNFMMLSVHYNDERRMKKYLLFGTALCIGLIGYFLEPTKVPPPPAQVAEVVAAIPEATTTPALPKNTYPVLKVVDGDTIDVLVDGKTVRLRLIGLDTPETVDPRKTVQCFGKEASDKAKELLVGNVVRLEYDASQGAFDKYRRTLAYIFLPDGTLYNKYMIAEGYAHEYTYNLPYKYQQEFKMAERQAREEKKGLWADGTCAGNTKKAATSL